MELKTVNESSILELTNVFQEIENLEIMVSAFLGLIKCCNSVDSSM